jgi:hypothetical protein
MLAFDSMKTWTLRVDDELQDQVDEARGMAPRESYIREIVRSHIAAVLARRQPLDGEILDSPEPPAGDPAWAAGLISPEGTVEVRHPTYSTVTGEAKAKVVPEAIASRHRHTPEKIGDVYYEKGVKMTARICGTCDVTLPPGRA